MGREVGKCGVGGVSVLFKGGDGKRRLPISLHSI